jgi:biotin transporter BioY
VYTPLSPVPYSLQVFGIALTGGLLGRKWATVSASTYVFAGIVGIPVFAGAWGEFETFRWFSGVDVFTGAIGAKALSMGYILGFIAQAHIIGWVADRHRAGTPNRKLPALATAAGGGLVLFALLDIYVLANYGTLYQNSPTAFPNAWFFVLSAALLVLVVGGAWLSFTSKARLERVELFFGNILALVALYAFGILGFVYIWNTLGFGPLATMDLLRFTVLPFIAADLTKVLLAIGLLTLLRPAQKEIDASRTPEAAAANV